MQGRQLPRVLLLRETEEILGTEVCRFDQRHRFERVLGKHVLGSWRSGALHVRSLVEFDVVVIDCELYGVVL